MKRRTNSENELKALVERYAIALSLYQRWETCGVNTVTEMRSSLAKMAKDAKTCGAHPGGRSADPTQQQLDWLREQLEMRVIGLGFVHFKLQWSSSSDATVGTVASLSEMLKEMLTEENQRRRTGNLPRRAAVPVMKRKTFKELGTPMVQAASTSMTTKDLDPEQLLKLAERKREELEIEGELDITSDRQPAKPPKLNDEFVGAEIEINWRYWTLDEKTGKRKAMLIWCAGEVVQIANGTSDKESPRCQKILQAGAVRIRWPADADFEEEETFSWSVLTEGNWNRNKHMGWRFSPAELVKRGMQPSVANAE
mmetsp:Transcript_3583/g.11053  ORF Transcript_3583/g.11053 Transcript_3583/m.11053 type:complete len:311 (-) Transcript_3583:70-1002(-)